MPVTILRGVSGSGKSTYAKKVPGVVCSADDFFMNEGTYRFNPRFLSEAHAACLRRFVGLMIRRRSAIVDNTNTRVIEMAPYVALAQAYGARIQVVTILCDPLVAAKRTRHFVPESTVLKQHQRLMREELPSEWPHIWVGSLASEG